VLWGRKKRVNSCGLASKKTKRNKIKKTKRVATVSTTQLQCWWCVGYKPAAAAADADAAAAEAEDNRIEEKNKQIKNCKKNSEKMLMIARLSN
jgi:hypothetical protein